jgi:hypothetical protein
MVTRSLSSGRGRRSGGMACIARTSFVMHSLTSSVNPVCSTGPAVFVDGWALAHLWLFWIAPILGGSSLVSPTHHRQLSERGAGSITKDCPTCLRRQHRRMLIETLEPNKQVQWRCLGDHRCWGATEQKTGLRDQRSASLGSSGLRSERNAPRATASGRAKVYRPSRLMWLQVSADSRATSSGFTG